MQAVTFIFAFVAVLALIVVAAWLVRRFAGNRLGANTSRGRMPRLAIIDAAIIDGRRRLVLVRRDNIEHLVMIARRGMRPRLVLAPRRFPANRRTSQAATTIRANTATNAKMNVTACMLCPRPARSRHASRWRPRRASHARRPKAEPNP